MILIELRKEQLPAFQAEMQEAFQKGYEAYYGQTDTQILPTDDIEQTLACPHTVVYEAIEEGVRLGGAIITLNEDETEGELDFLYVRVGSQNRGVATFIWTTIETLYPGVKVWETCTPYFDKRNIHFYVNKCHFHIVEFYNDRHKDPNYPVPEQTDPMEDGFFRFRKVR